MTVCGLLFIGAVLGWGCAALFYQRQRDDLARTKQALLQANAATSAANDIIEAQKVQIRVQQETISYARQEVASMVSDKWPLMQQAKNNGTMQEEQP